jgi:hypothetical protein
MSDLPHLQDLLIDAAVRRRRRRRVVRSGRVAVLAAAAVTAVIALPRPADVEVPADRPGSVEAAYGVFRRPASKADGGPDSRVIGAGGRAFLRRFDGEVCLVLKTHGEGRAPCGPLGAGLDGFLKQDFAGGTAFAFQDGVRSVSLILANGDERTVPVVDNGVVVDLPSAVVRANWTAPDGRARGADYPGATGAAKAFAVLRTPEQTGGELPGLPGSRLALSTGAVKAWLVPRRGAICLVVQIKDRSTAGCRPIAIHAPMLVALPGGAGGRVVVAAYPDAITGVSVAPKAGLANAAYSANVLLWSDGGEPRTLRYVTHDGPVRRNVPTFMRAFPFNARAQDPKTLPDP